MLDRFTGLHVFARVANLGSLSGAARALGMSQTMATKHIAALEERLGVKLLHRTTRKITLTEPGRRYLESAERILGELEEADAPQPPSASKSPACSGSTHLSRSGCAKSRLSWRISPASTRPCPSIWASTTASWILVEEGWDVAIRIGGIRDQTLIVRKLAPCHLLVVASPDISPARKPKRWADLAAHNCLGYTLSSALGPDQWHSVRTVRSACRSAGPSRPTTATLWWPQRRGARARLRADLPARRRGPCGTARAADARPPSAGTARRLCRLRRQPPASRQGAGLHRLPDTPLRPEFRHGTEISIFKVLAQKGGVARGDGRDSDSKQQHAAEIIGIDISDRNNRLGFHVCGLTQS